MLKTFGAIKTYLLEFLFPKTRYEKILSEISVANFLQEVEKNFRTDNIAQSILSYRDPLVRALIWLIKYKRRDYAIKIAAQILLDETLEEQSEQMTFSGGKKTILIPIPISPARLRERGYNQMNLVAEEIMRLGGDVCFELRTDILQKTKDTKSQTCIKIRRERLENVVGVFGVAHPEIIRNRRVLIIDDVFTTGATLKEARRALRAAGLRKIELLTIAH